MTWAEKFVQVEFFCNWCEYGEYVKIEFDTEAGTATVVKK